MRLKLLSKLFYLKKGKYEKGDYCTNILINLKLCGKSKIMLECEIIFSTLT